MADPTAAAITTHDISRSTMTGGACREYWLRFPGLSAASDCDTAGSVLYYLENPYKMDLVILTALAVITTLDAQDGDIDVGLADDAAGTNVGQEIFDSLVNTAVGVFEGTTPQAVAGTGSKAIWKENGNSTDAFLCIVQQADADVSALRWHLYLKVIPYDDLTGDEGEQAVLAVA
jgi:hypothetical protein